MTTPMTRRVGIIPPPGLPSSARESVELSRLSPMSHNRSAGTSTANGVAEAGWSALGAEAR